MAQSTPEWLYRHPTSARAGNPRRISFGADYNPEQWPREVWDEDMRLMKQADVDVVSIAIFSWARLQPAEDRWDFAWLDELMDLLAKAGIGADLATATASPPAWLAAQHPEILPVTENGTVLSPGGRQHWRPTSPVFREHALTLVRTLAERYGGHPALVAWHVNNELGCHNLYDYSDDAARAFRVWLHRRYGTVEELNRAWSTDFWSQRYQDFDQILPPRTAAAFPNPAQQLDFHRFSSNALKQHFIAERDVLRGLTPEVPVTTNFMVVGETKGMNFADWAEELDFVANDHYRLPVENSQEELSFSAAITSGLAQGEPWFLMEHSTSAVNWQPINRPKRSGELQRDSLAHVAHGADAVCYFQWRQSAGGAEKYHSAMVPHAGEDSRLYRSVVKLGQTLRRLDPVAGSRRRPAQVALLMDWESWWTSELDSHPTEDLRYRPELFGWWLALLDTGVRADVVQSRQDFSGYDMVIAPVLHMVPAALQKRLEQYVASGGHLVTTFFSGTVDQDDRVWLGGYPGALRELLGIRVEEFSPLLRDESVTLDDGSTGRLWSEPVDVADDVVVLRRYRGGDLDGRAAITRREHGSGSAAYVSTQLDTMGRSSILRELLRHTEVVAEVPASLRGRIEITRRTGDAGDFLFIINRTDEVLDISEFEGHDLIGADQGSKTLAARGVAVLREVP
ncbi:beta-galactosidase [Nesterenkonia lutea]|uniref:Beta-galactosidase n=1 Tax=Nesterenkonia lutea TaxID=272919 RepID=A0ABR9JD01_9MICC|nr:beta-galactosidase [Nesterenkonia lutea]MBE1523362.1 beta-galactosidase [Nesterenkonia lutea]